MATKCPYAAVVSVIMAGSWIHCVLVFLFFGQPATGYTGVDRIKLTRRTIDEASPPYDLVQDPFATANGLTGEWLKQKLHRLLKDAHRPIGRATSHNAKYKMILSAFRDTDTSISKTGQHCVVDRYSKSRCFDLRADTCRQVGHTEGVCYNREHSWPKSWWGSGGRAKSQSQHSDLHHIFPTDGYVNQRRGNHMLGTVAKGECELTTSNGCQLGRCKFGCGDQGCTCFEPADEFKGEFARAYFYMAVRYLDQVECCTNEAVRGFDIQPAMEQELRHWHDMHPPTQRERHRNDAVERWQGNRNPFIDRPEWVRSIADL